MDLCRSNTLFSLLLTSLCFCLISAVDLGTEAYAGMPLAPSTFYPWWWTGGMPVGIDGCMAPFAANFSYIGYPSGFSDGTFGVTQPQGQLPAQYYMMSSVLPRYAEFYT